jgi:hypothetical protein
MVSRIFSHYFSARPRAEPHRQPRQQVMASKGAKPGKIAYWGAEVGLATFRRKKHVFERRRKNLAARQHLTKPVGL